MIQVPRFFTAKSIDEALACIDAVMLDESDQIICDAGNTRFVDPLGLCLLVHAMQDANIHGQTIRLEGLSEELRGYMARMDVFRQGSIRFQENFRRRDRRRSLVEVRPVEHPGEVDDVAVRLAQAITGWTRQEHGNADVDAERAGMAPRDQLMDSMRYLLTETLENSLTHAKRHGYENCTALVAAQYYPHSDLIRFAVVDNGCGFLRSLLHHHELNEKTDAAAIQLAVQSFVSCNRDVGLAGVESHNQGVGLTLCQQLVLAANGRMFIGSSEQTVNFSKDRTRVINTPSWRGSFFAAEVNRRQFSAVSKAELFRRIRRQGEDDVDIVFID